MLRASAKAREEEEEEEGEGGGGEEYEIIARTTPRHARTLSEGLMRAEFTSFHHFKLIYKFIQNKIFVCTSHLVI
jgi:hypothetical protein